MIIRKVIGKNEVRKIFMTNAEYDILKRMGVTDIEAYVMQEIRKVAKKRKWTWWLKRHPE